MTELPNQFSERMKERLGKDFPAFLRSYETPPCRGLRVNTLKISAEEFCRRAPFPLGERIAWERNGFYHTAEKPGGDVYHFAGLYYLQEPSAMCAAPLLGVSPGDRVLDLCAAPGGKTTQLAADMGGTGTLVANEIDPSRARILAQNTERLGITNCMVMSASPQSLSNLFPAYFDKILVDAPCSGEGMFKKEENAIPEWSAENVARCAARQEQILEEAAKMLAGGGRLVYSTCTFAEEEDEGQIAHFLRLHPEFTLLSMKKLYPHEVKGEGHFAALLEKEEGERSAQPCLPRASRSARNSTAGAERAYVAFARDFFADIPEGNLLVRGNEVRLVPGGLPAEFCQGRYGVKAGEWDGKIFKPDHALAMAFGGKAARKVRLTREESERYLHGETLETGLEDGWCVVCVEEFPLGLGKAVGGTVKNHLPKGLRMIR